MKIVYSVVLTKKFEKQLSKLDVFNANIMLKWIDINIDQIENPIQKGKALHGNYDGLWRYRVGDYRIICKIEDQELLVLALELGHSREKYKK